MATQKQKFNAHRSNEYDRYNENIQNHLIQIDYSRDRCATGSIGKVRLTQELIDHAFNNNIISNEQRNEYTEQLKLLVKKFINSCICDSRDDIKQ